MRIAAFTVPLAIGSVLVLNACTLSTMGAAEYFGRSDLERAVEHILEEQGQRGVFMPSCPNTLEIRVDAVTQCTVRHDDASVVEVTVVVIEAAGSRGRIALK